MKRNKFKFQTVEGTITGIEWAEFKQAMVQFERGEILIREEVEWDTDQMRKYFHGPVRAFILEELRKTGFNTTADQIKFDLKQMYGPKYNRVGLNGKTTTEPKSMADYSEKEYCDILNRTDEWCMDKLGCGLPPAESVE